MAKLNDKYETVMIFNTKNGDEAVKALVEKFTALIEKHGTLETVEEWGKRRLAYLDPGRGRGLLRIRHLHQRSRVPGRA